MYIDFPLFRLLFVNRRPEHLQIPEPSIILVRFPLQTHKRERDGYEIFRDPYIVSTNLSQNFCTVLKYKPNCDDCSVKRELCLLSSSLQT